VTLTVCEGGCGGTRDASGMVREPVAGADRRSVEGGAGDSGEFSNEKFRGMECGAREGRSWRQRIERESNGIAVIEGAASFDEEVARMWRAPAEWCMFEGGPTW